MFTLTVVGAETFTIPQECITSAEFITEIPKDSDARTGDVGITLIVEGKILAAKAGDPIENTRQLALWAMMPSEKADGYRGVLLESVRGNVVLREYHLPNAFATDFKEDFRDKEGVGTFTVKLKQKKDRIESVTVNGGYLK